MNDTFGVRIGQGFADAADYAQALAERVLAVDVVVEAGSRRPTSLRKKSAHRLACRFRR